MVTGWSKVRSVEVRTYKGKDEAEANRLFHEEAGRLGAVGYRPTRQVWAKPDAGWVVPFALMVPGYLIGGGYGLVVVAAVDVVYILVSSHRARGTLSVTFRRY